MVRERLKTEKALYSLDMETLERIRPELIVTQALCDVCAVAEKEVNDAACSLPGFAASDQPRTDLFGRSVRLHPSRGVGGGHRRSSGRGGRRVEGSC